MDADERLAAAAGGAARYMADTAGLENSEILGLQAAVVAACKYCFHCHSSATHCDISLQKLTDRIVTPIEAVVEEGAEFYVYRQNGKNFDRVPVHVEVLRNHRAKPPSAHAAPAVRT